MSRVARLYGAILVESGRDYFLVGNTKLPADWAAAGFEAPPEVDALRRPFVRLSPVRPVELEPPVLLMGLEGETLAAELASRLVIARNGSVSERLWRLVTSPDPEADAPAASVADARWLGEVPAHLWAIVKDNVLRCS